MILSLGFVKNQQYSQKFEAITVQLNLLKNLKA